LIAVALSVGETSSPRNSTKKTTSPKIIGPNSIGGGAGDPASLV